MKKKKENNPGKVIWVNFDSVKLESTQVLAPSRLVFRKGYAGDGGNLSITEGQCLHHSGQKKL